MGVRRHRSEEGVSELVGAMLLLGLTVIGVALVGIVFLSAPPSRTRSPPGRPSPRELTRPAASSSSTMGGAIP